MAAIFLATTSEIRRQRFERLSKCKSINLAVAFIIGERSELLGDFKGKCRVICWLSSKNTHFCAVEQILHTKKNFRVKHCHGMHAKVYPGKGGWWIRDCSFRQSFQCCT